MYPLRKASVTVALDTKLTPELIEEGFVREIISKVQTMRKEAGFEVMDRIACICCRIMRRSQVCLKEHAEVLIKKEVLADDIILGSD